MIYAPAAQLAWVSIFQKKLDLAIKAKDATLAKTLRAKLTAQKAKVAAFAKSADFRKLEKMREAHAA